jgi:hypothetical protein
VQLEGLGKSNQTSLMVLVTASSNSNHYFSEFLEEAGIV